MPYRDKSDGWAFGVLMYEVNNMYPENIIKHLVTLTHSLSIYLCNHVACLCLNLFSLTKCATLQHPFEARNQCALIMKIIEAEVKPPSSSAVSMELRHLILWLLTKDPNLRPSIRDVLNEVRESVICEEKYHI